MSKTPSVIDMVLYETFVSFDAYACGAIKRKIKIIDKNFFIFTNNINVATKLWKGCECTNRRNYYDVTKLNRYLSMK